MPPKAKGRPSSAGPAKPPPAGWQDRSSHVMQAQATNSRSLASLASVTEDAPASPPGSAVAGVLVGGAAQHLAGGGVNAVRSRPGSAARSRPLSAASSRASVASGAGPEPSGAGGKRGSSSSSNLLHTAQTAQTPARGRAEVGRRSEVVVGAGERGGGDATASTSRGRQSRHTLAMESPSGGGGGSSPGLGSPDSSLSRSPSVGGSALASTRASTSRPPSAKADRHRPFVPDPHRPHEPYTPYVELDRRKLGSFAKSALKDFRQTMGEQDKKRAVKEGRAKGGGLLGGDLLSSPPGSPRSPRISATQMDREHQALQGTMKTLREAFEKLAIENGRLHRERKENLHLIERLQKDDKGALQNDLQDHRDALENLNRVYHKVAQKCQAQAAKLKKATLAMKVAEADAKRAEKDSKTMMSTVISVQKENVNLVQNPLVKVLQKKLQELALKYKEIVEQMKVANTEQEERVVSLTDRLTGIDASVDELWQTTKQLVLQRQDAAKLIASGKEKIQEFKTIQEHLTAQLEKMRSKVEEAVRQCRHTMERLSTDTAKVDKLTTQYRTVLEDLIGQNKMWQQKYKEDVGRLEAEKEALAEETEQFRAENKALLESLMTYLLLNQTKERIRGSEKAKEILTPLCKEADRHRKEKPEKEYEKAKTPRSPTESERPLNERQYPSTDDKPTEKVVEALRAMPERPPDMFKGLAQGLPLMTSLYTDGF